MVERQQEAALRLLETPKTIEELVDETGGNYWSLYRVVKTLIDEGRVVEQPWRRGRKIVYVKSTAPVRGQIRINIAGGQPSHLGNFTGKAPLNPAQVMRGAFSYLWRRSYHIPPVGQEWDVTKPLGTIEVIKVKEHLRKVAFTMKQMELVIKQALDANIWAEDDRALVDKFGPVGEIQYVLDAAQEFEDYLKEAMK